MDNPPEILPSDPKWLKKMLNKLIKEYLYGGVSQQAVVECLDAFGLPEEMMFDHELRELHIVRLWTLIFQRLLSKSLVGTTSLFANVDAGIEHK